MESIRYQRKSPWAVKGLSMIWNMPTQQVMKEMEKEVTSTQ
jgi:hypothetical protein